MVPPRRLRRWRSGQRRYGHEAGPVTDESCKTIVIWVEFAEDLRSATMSRGKVISQDRAGQFNPNKVSWLPGKLAMPSMRCQPATSPSQATATRGQLARQARLKRWGDQNKVRTALTV